MKLANLNQILIFLIGFISTPLIAAPQEIKISKSLPPRVNGTYTRAYWYEGSQNWKRLIKEDKSFFLNKSGTFRRGDYVKVQFLERMPDFYIKKTPSGEVNYEYIFFEKTFDCRNGLSGYKTIAFAGYDYSQKDRQGKPDNSEFYENEFSSVYRDPMGLRLTNIDNQPKWFYFVGGYSKLLEDPVLTPTKPGTYGESMLVAACNNIK